MKAVAQWPAAQRGFTLIELVTVIIVAAVLGAALVVFVKPAMDAYLTSRARADLTDQADTALRRMVRDVRLSVPNSVRTPGPQCLELLPTSTGGRYRAGPETVNDSGPGCAPAVDCSASLDPARATTAFDVLTPLSATPEVGDWVVVGNQTPADAYGGVNRAAITAVTTPAAAYGRLRLSIASTQFPLGHDGARFTVVPNTQKAVFYVCSGADGTLDARGDGRGTLYRSANYGFNAAYPTACPSVATAAVLATRVRSCNLVYDPNQGSTQQNGFVWMELELARNGEAVHLSTGAHVANGP